MQNRHEIVILGPAKTGKTQLVNRLVGKPFDSRYQGTIGIEPSKLSLSEQQAILYRDIAGDTDPGAMYKTIQSACEIYIVFNAYNADGFRDLQEYIKHLKFPDAVPITLIGTHDDLGIKTAVENAAKAHAIEKKLDYFAISLSQDNSPVIEKLREKSNSLFSTPIIPVNGVHTKRQSSSNGSVHSDGSGVLTLTSVNLHRHTTAYASQNPRKTGSLGSKRKNVYGSEHSFDLGYTKDMNGNSMPPAPASRCCSFALRMAGMAMILAALIGLIYIALAVVNIISAAALISLMNNIVVGVGSLLGASAATSLMTISQVGASLNVSTTAVAGMFMAVPSVALLVAGYGAFRAGGQKPDHYTEDNPGLRKC